MKHIIILGVMAFLFLGCIQKTIQISENRPGTIIYEEPIVHCEPVVLNERHELPVASSPQRGKTYSVEPIKAYDMLQGDPFVMLLDVRMAYELKKGGKIANSLLIPLSFLGQHLHKIDKSKKILVYCDTGNRSREAVQLLSNNGYEAINLNGGITKWKAEHLPVRYGR